MPSILIVDDEPLARERLAAKRGGGEWAVTLDEAAQVAPVRAERLLALDEALARLAVLDERQARIVECRFFTGLTVEETAAVLALSTPTVKRDWRAARAWITTAARPVSNRPSITLCRSSPTT